MSDAVGHHASKCSTEQLHQAEKKKPNGYCWSKLTSGENNAQNCNCDTELFWCRYLGKQKNFHLNTVFLNLLLTEVELNHTEGNIIYELVSVTNIALKI